MKKTMTIEIKENTEYGNSEKDIVGCDEMEDSAVINTSNMNNRSNLRNGRKYDDMWVAKKENEGIDENEEKEDLEEKVEGKRGKLKKDRKGRSKGRHLRDQNEDSEISKIARSGDTKSFEISEIENKENNEEERRKEEEKIGGRKEKDKREKTGYNRERKLDDLFDVQIAVNSVALSALAYCDYSLILRGNYSLFQGINTTKTDIFPSQLDDFKVTKYFLGFRDLNGFLGYTEKSKSIFIVFRGSASAENWDTNFHTKRVAYPSCIK